MIPCLYHVGETEYKTNGIGKLADCTSCTVTEERNSSYELALTYPTDGIHAESLVEGNIILAKPADNKSSQPFRIYKVTTSLNGTLEVAARHISYQLNDITVSPTTVVTGTYDQVNAAFAALKENATTDCPFEFETDISSEAYFGILEPVSFRSALGGVDGSILDTFGGEFEWDFYTVRLWKSRGSDNGVRIVYGKNLVDFRQEKDAGNVITGVHPYWKDAESGDITELPEKVVLLEDSDSPYERIGLLDCSSEYEEEPTWDQLRSYAGSYLTSTTTTEPNIDIDIDFAQLWQTPGYEDIVEAERVSLCDTVHVFITKLGIEVSTVVTQTVYDVLLEKYQSITLSNSPTSTRNSSLNLTLATTSQVKTLIAMTDTSIRLSVSSRYATKATLENDYSTTVEVQSMIELSEEGITLAFDKKLSDEYSTTQEILSMIELSESGILLEFDKYSTTEEVQSMIQLSEEGITLSFEQTLEDYSTTAQVQSLISASEEGITLSFEKTLGDYSTTSEVQSMIKASEDGIALTYVKNGEVRSQFAMEDDSITISSGTITFNTGTLLINSSQFTLSSNGNATFSGTLSAPSGTIGGWTINSTTLSSGSGTNYVCLSSSGTNAIYAGASSASSAPFLVTADGSVRMSSGLVWGTLAIYDTNGRTQYGKIGYMSGSDDRGSTDGIALSYGTSSNYYFIATSSGTRMQAMNTNFNVVNGGATLTGSDLIVDSGYVYAGTTSNTANRAVYARNAYGGAAIFADNGSSANSGLVDVASNTYYAYWNGANSRYVFGRSSYPTRIIGDGITLASSTTISGTTTINSSLYTTGSVYLGGDVNMWHGTYGGELCMWCYETGYFDGNLGCSGTKYRIVDTEHYGKIGMNAYETASAMFGDSGSGTVGKDGQITVFFPSEFIEVIDADADYQVFTTQVSPGSISYVEKQNGSFTVYGEPGTEFDWMVSAHQRDYTMNRMESVDLDAPENIEFDESIFDQDLVAEEAVNAMIENYEREVNLV